MGSWPVFHRHLFIIDMKRSLFLLEIIWGRSGIVSDKKHYRIVDLYPGDMYYAPIHANNGIRIMISRDLWHYTFLKITVDSPISYERFPITSYTYTEAIFKKIN